MSRVEVDLAGLMMRIEQRGERAVKGVSDVMQRNGDKIRDLAREFAPIDEGYLEKAIIKSTNYTGVNRRAVIDIGVDLNFAGSGGAQTVAQYADFTHEGSYNLGIRSQAKDGGRGVVGRKYLTRAFLTYEKAIREQANEIVRKAYSR